MTPIPKPEILAPAGDPASFLAALAAGADAVYCGLKHFSARMLARNFSVGELALRRSFGVTLLAVSREDGVLSNPGADDVLRAGRARGARRNAGRPRRAGPGPRRRGRNRPISRRVRPPSCAWNAVSGNSAGCSKWRVR